MSFSDFALIISMVLVVSFIGGLAVRDAMRELPEPDPVLESIELINIRLDALAREVRINSCIVECKYDWGDQYACQERCKAE